MSTFTLAISFDYFQFALIHGPDIPGSYAILLFIALDLASLTSHSHSWVLFLLWLHPFIFSGVISPLISSSILGSYWPEEFLFQCPIILPFHAAPSRSLAHHSFCIFLWRDSQLLFCGCWCEHASACVFVHLYTVSLVQTPRSGIGK